MNYNKEKISDNEIKFIVTIDLNTMEEVFYLTMWLMN